MIAQNEILQKWVEDLRTNPEKATGKLQSTAGGNCCLGRLCLVAGWTPSLLPREPRDSYLVFGVKNCEAELPEELCELMNTTRTGTFTLKGMSIVALWFRENHFKNTLASSWPRSLAYCNDKYEMTLQDIGALIEHLAWVERALGVECFIPFSRSLTRI